MGNNVFAIDLFVFAPIWILILWIVLVKMFPTSRYFIGNYATVFWIAAFFWDFFLYLQVFANFGPQMTVAQYYAMTVTSPNLLSMVLYAGFLVGLIYATSVTYFSKMIADYDTWFMFVPSVLEVVVVALALYLAYIYLVVPLNALIG